MRKAVALLSVVALTILLTSGALGVEAHIYPNSQELNSAKQSSGEVDRLDDQLKSKDETIVSSCLEGCQSKKSVDDLNGGEILQKSLPEYPVIARMARASGSVVVLVAVDEEGNVIAAQSVSGHPLLQAAAVKAARETVFSPFLLGGRPVKVKGNLTYTFLID
jgi:TonB family protein